MYYLHFLANTFSIDVSSNPKITKILKFLQEMKADYLKFLTIYYEPLDTNAKHEYILLPMRVLKDLIWDAPLVKHLRTLHTLF